MVTAHDGRFPPGDTIESVLAEEIVKKLKEQGHHLGKQVVNSNGQIIWSVDGVGMFHQDAADLAKGRATVEQIIKRNAGRDIPLV